MQTLKHPCFEKRFSKKYARIHLPVAPRCNIQCRYCNRKYDCANESRPGVTSKVLTPEEALQVFEEKKMQIPELTVAGVAGPGEPLYNESTFETLIQIKRKFPEIIICLSTNGALLEEKIEQLKECKTETLTITLNSLKKTKIPDIYRHTGLYSSDEFLERQKNGIIKAVEAGFLIKINTILIPGINEMEIMEIADFGKKAGAIRMNLTPLIPQGELSYQSPPSKMELDLYRKKASFFLPQMYHCQQCRADACGFL